MQQDLGGKRVLSFSHNSISQRRRIRDRVNKLEYGETDFLKIAFWLAICGVGAQPIVQFDKEFSDLFSHKLLKYRHYFPGHTASRNHRALDSLLRVLPIHIELKCIGETGKRIAKELELSGGHFFHRNKRTRN